MKKTFIALFVALVALAAMASALPITINQIEVDGVELAPNDVNRVDLERGSSFDVRIELMSTQDLQDVELEAFISGYEYNDKEAISDTTHVFDMEANVVYVKHLELTLPDKVDTDDYRLRVLVTDRDDQQNLFDYSVKVDTQRHNLKIKDVLVTPEYGAKAGEALLMSVRVKNFGQKDEESVKVSMSLPELGISTADYIDAIESGETESSEELYVVIPECTKGGEYRLDVTLTYDEGFEKVTQSGVVEVKSGICPADEVVMEEEETPAEPDFTNELTPAENTATLRTALEIGLVALIVILVILGLVIGFTKLGSKGQEF